MFTLQLADGLLFTLQLTYTMEYCLLSNLQLV
jgi:hypothetical protein